MQPAISQRRRGRGDMERNRLNERRMRVLGFPHCPNFRDLGGYKTADGKAQLRYGQLYRHGRLSELSAHERAHLGEQVSSPRIQRNSQWYARPVAAELSGAG